MFSNVVIDSDRFLDLPPMAQLLYFHLGMKTDDDGFVGGAKRTARNIGATDDDLQALIDEGFLLDFPDSRVFLMAHHRINNFLQNDRHHDTVYQTEFAQVEEKDKVYRHKRPDDEPLTSCQQGVNEPEAEQNVAQNNVTQKNVTQSSGGEGSDEGGDPSLIRYVISTRLQSYPKEHNAVLKYLDRGGNPEKARLAVHEWEQHDRRGSVTDYLEKGGIV
jgi:hypothetical protein